MEQTQLRENARQSIRAGDRAHAEDLCRRLLTHDANDTFANSFLAFEALQRGDFAAAIEFSSAAIAGNPNDSTLWQNLGLAQFAAGEVDAAIESYDKGLTVNPNHGLLWLYRGQAETGLDKDRAARSFVRAFQEQPALAQAYRMGNAPPGVRDLSRMANEVVRDIQYGDQQAAIEAAMAMPLADTPLRLQKYLRVFHGLESTDYDGGAQRPDFQYYPGLTAHPFWQRDEFDWVPRVEEALTVLQAEARTAITRPMTPYVGETYRADPTWKTLAGRNQWASFHLFKSGERIPKNCAACPATDALLRSLPLADIPHHAPEAFFSVLQPRTRIPPHYGISNIKLTVHMPLIVPGSCGIRVDNEQRTWQPGQCMIFDDSFLHEAWNDSDEVRIVLIFEVWNPDLSEEEKSAIQAVIETRHRWLEDA